MITSEYSLEESLGYHLGKPFRLLQFAMDKFFEEKKWDITTDDWAILIFLFHKNASNQQFLSCIITKDKTTITRIIDSLENKKYVMRVPSKEDRRQNEIVLTENGKKFVKKLLPIITEAANQIIVNISEEDYKAFKRVTEKISQNIIDRIKK